MNVLCRTLCGFAVVLLVITASAAELTREAVLSETLKPYAGPSVRGVDTGTLSNKVMCGYQGWFNAEDDGAERGWVHWTKRRGPLVPGNAKIDLLPDVSELGADERFATGFTNSAGKEVEVFSPFRAATVLRHFRWMREYGIDGVFVQRFITDLRDPRALRHNNTVLAHCREGANRSGRVYAVMYDLSGLGAGRIQEVMDDWRSLRTRMHVTEDPAYLRHRGHPLVTVWGVGFNDNRRYTLEECRRLVEFLKADGCSVMLGVPTGFRELNRDAVNDPALHELLGLADVISPWTVGRYRDSSEAARHGEKTWQPDIAWCAERKADFLPVVFPGFSWFNMYGKQFDAIPRRKGEFLWSQFVAAKRAGAQMIYVAMFDEVDEGTAIFKCTDEVPVGQGAKFLTYEGLPSDFYLRLTGAGARMLRGELPVTDEMPTALASMVTERRKVVGYAPTWVDQSALAESIDFPKLTHLNLAFANPTNAAGALSFNSPSEVLLARARAHHVKTLISIGGGGAAEDKTLLARYADLMSEPKRASFVVKLADYVAAHGFDGLDVDLEGPGIGPDYGAFIADLAAALKPQGKLLTAALSKGYGGSKVTDSVFGHFDFVNIMAYDATGTWNPNAPGQHSSLEFAKDNVAYWLRRGLPKAKAVLGVPFYGYGFGAAFRKRDYPYSTIVASYPGAENLDQIGDTIWYNGIPTIRAKARYVAEQGLGGMMIWSLDYDVKGERSLLTAVHEGLTQPLSSPTRPSEGGRENH